MLIRYAMLALTVLIAQPSDSAAREQIRVVGSSTVFPFVASAAEHFGRLTGHKTPIVEATGTGGGIKLFCDGVGEAFPDMANASRPIKPAEIDQCKANGVTDITELAIGFDGIVLANAKQSRHFDISKEHIFLALARTVPKDGKLVVNPYTRWSDIDPALPHADISVYGPPPTSGTRDAFVELVMDQGCKAFPEFAAAYSNPDELKQQCGMVREDGRFIEAGENDNLIVQKLIANPDAIGIFGFSFLDQNAATVKANKVGGVAPSFAHISNGSYGISRSLYVYVKNQHLSTVAGLADFARSIVSDEAVGDDGYLILKGLIPLPPKEHKAMKKRAAKL